MTPMLLRTEFHCHTIYSKDSLLQPQAMLAACQRKGIDRLIITDHNSIAGAIEAQRLDLQRVIVGEEIMTTCGEILAAFVCEEIPAGLEPGEVIQRLRAQGAFISVSHPFDHVRRGSWRLENLLKILPLVDAIEVFNSRCLAQTPNQQAQELARQYNLAGTVGSDAHMALELGQSTLLLPDFHNAQELKQVIRQAEAHTRPSSPLVHLNSSFSKWYKKLKRKPKD